MVDCGLSTRIAKELGKPLRDDLVFLDEIFQDRYHHEENVSGRIPLFTAENVLGWSMLKEKLNEISKIPLDDWTFQYTSVHGYPEVLEVLAGFVGTFIAGNEVTLDSNCFALSLKSCFTLSAGLINNTLVFSLCNLSGSVIKFSFGIQIIMLLLVQFFPM